MNPLLKSLKARHGLLQSRIEEEQKRLQPDSLRVSALKKLKLHLRDQITFLERMEAGRSPVIVVRRKSSKILTAGR